MILLYLVAAIACSMVYLALGSLVPLRIRLGTRKVANLLTSLSFLWHLTLVAVCIYVVHQTSSATE